MRTPILPVRRTFFARAKCRWLTRRPLHDAVTKWIESTGGWVPPLCLALFLAASFVMIWRLEAMASRGMEGTVLGTLVMPYCSGLGNLLFAYVLGQSGGDSREVMTNSLVNNVTNMTLLIGLPMLFFGLALVPAKSGKSKGKKGKGGAQERHRLTRLSLLLTLLAALFFAGTMWALGRDGRIESTDGLVLVGMFLFWQAFHVYEVLKSNVQQRHAFGFMFLIDFAILIVAGYGVYVSIDFLVGWVQSLRTGFINAKHLGWLSGWLMVLPNGLLAMYYGYKRRAEVVYSSQVGDGHICIPLCIGVYALWRPIPTPDFFNLGVALLAGVVAAHMLVVAIFDRIPRFLGLLLMAGYGVFIWKGLIE